MRILLALVVAVLAGTAAAQEAGAPAGTRRTVVVLYSLPQSDPGLHGLGLALTDGLQKGSKVPLDIYGEYTGLDRFSGVAYEDALLALYREKYGSRKVDLLVVVGPTALEFVVARNVLPGVPIGARQGSCRRSSSCCVHLGLRVEEHLADWAPVSR